MSRIRTIMLSMLAVFAIEAVASASASAAAPEFFHCVAHAGGGFAAGCKVTGAGFEKEAVPAGSSIKFTSISEPSYLFANASGTFRIKCEADTSKGEVTGPKTVAGVKVIFTKCRGFKGSEECPVKSVGAGGAEEIVTETLSGELGTVAAAEAPDSETGLSLKPPAMTPFVKLIGKPTTCIPETSVTGSVIGEVEPVKIMDTTGELIYSVLGTKKTKQGIQKIGAEPKDTLTAFGVEVGFESEGAITFEEAIEVGEGGEEPKISITPTEWSGGGKCAMKGTNVLFTVKGQWCQYTIKNLIAETVEVRAQGLNRLSPECEGLPCVKLIKPVGKECVGANLAGGESCVSRVEYANKTANPPQALGYDVIVKSLVGKTGTEEVFQTVE
jgi:hypothetical protein